MHKFSNEEEFNSLLKSKTSNIILTHFCANWAPQCAQISDALAELIGDDRFKDVVFCELEAEEIPSISQRYEIAAVPTCIILRNGNVVERINGANVPDLIKKLTEQAAISPVMTKQAPPKEDLNTRLKMLINKAPVMLFMKGDPEQPRCGFSKQIIQILNEQNVKFSTFDILEDEEIRQGLKKYSDWPTYPQLYGDGELIGGLDIIRELVETGELKSQIPQQESLDDRLKRLINQQTVMLFMKGDPQGPRCGFSKTTVALLNETGIPYGHFDILEDQEVRQGLKKFSDWPTYPQVYVKGELIGGLNILQEMKENGELEAALKGE